MIFIIYSVGIQKITENQKGLDMATGNKQAVELIVGIIKEMKLKHEPTEIVYRPDYQDYQVLFGDSHHCEIQEKFIDDVLTFKSGDAKRQIQFMLNHLVAWQEWEKPAKPMPQDEKIAVDDE